MNRYMEQFIREHPDTYQLYLRGRKLLEPFVPETVLDDMSIEYLGNECGIFFSVLLFTAEKEHFLDEFTPDEMSIMIYWTAIEYDYLASDFARIKTKYYALTGKHVSN